MSKHEKQKKNFVGTNDGMDSCGFSQKQALAEMKKEDERKMIGNMLKKL